MKKIHEFNFETNTLKLKGGWNNLPLDKIKDFGFITKILDASDNKLTFLPLDFPELFPDVEVLLLSNNNFAGIPNVLSGCKNLKILALKSCGIKYWPENALPSSLIWLMLTDNKISEIPKTIGKLVNLRKLALAGNLIEFLPEEILDCKNIELLRVSANKLTEPQLFITQLPRLAWYSEAGNPFDKQEEWFLQEIPEELNHGIFISESPSSVVYKGSYKAHDVAIKVFKSDSVTSDGYSISDIFFSSKVKGAKNTINFLGQFINKENKKVLVSELIPKDYKKLGNPPNFKTCTRDSFDKYQFYNIKFILKVLEGVALAISDMHNKKGISHGDIYAHNILVNPEGRAVIGDFGAASFHQNRYTVLDVRAFGNLILDLVSVCRDFNSKDRLIKTKLIEISKLCFSNSYINIRQIRKKITSIYY